MNTNRSSRHQLSRSCGTGAHVQGDSKRKFNQGLAAKKRGDLNRAKKLFTDALTSRRVLLGAHHPDVAAAHEMLGDVAAEMGREDEAREHYGAAVRILDEGMRASAGSTGTPKGNASGVGSRGTCIRGARKAHSRPHGASPPGRGGSKSWGGSSGSADFFAMKRRVQASLELMNSANKDNTFGWNHAKNEDAGQSSQPCKEPVIELIQQQKWDDVILRCKTHPKESKQKYADGGMALHWACTLQAPLPLLQALHDANADAISTPDACSELPLHRACHGGRNCNLEILRFLHRLYPDGVRQPNASGWLPLHVAVSSGAPIEIVRFLFDAHPEAAIIKAHRLKLPIHMATSNNAPFEVIEFLHRQYVGGAMVKDASGVTPVQYAEKSKRVDRDEVVALLKNENTREFNVKEDSQAEVESRTTRNSSGNSPPAEVLNHSLSLDETTDRRANIEKGRDLMKSVLHIRAPPVPIPIEYLEHITLQFALSRKIGEGAFGVVYKGCDKALRGAFAVKRFRANIGVNRSVREAKRCFRREIEVLSRFNHPNIARLYAYHMANRRCGEHCLVYDLASNGSLENFLRDDKERERLSWKTRVCIAFDVSKALRYLHEGGLGYTCFHRDVKPGNIVLRRDFTALLTDCGLSKLVPDDENQLGSSIISGSGGSSVLGTPGYCCPEDSQSRVLDGNFEYTSASDVFSLGIVFMELLNGRLQNHLLEDGRKVNFFRKYRKEEDRNNIEADVDPLSGEWDRSALFEFCSLSLECIEPQKHNRPAINSVVRRLQRLAVQHCGVDPTVGVEELRGNCNVCAIKDVVGFHCRETSSAHFICSGCFGKHVNDHIGDELILCPVDCCQSTPFTDEDILFATSRRTLWQHMKVKGNRVLDKEKKRAQSDASDASELRTITKDNRIAVIFSAPLVWRDEYEEFQPIEKIDYEREREILFRCLQEASKDVELSFDVATVDRLQSIVTTGCGCLHYSGHGIANYLVFEDNKGGVHWLGIDELSMVLSKGAKAGKPLFSFVFVSACDSQATANTFIEAGIPHVLCCRQGEYFMDTACQVFTKAFYFALVNRHTIKESFDIGLQAVAVSPVLSGSSEEQNNFLLLPEGGDHNVVLFDTKDLREWPRSGQITFNGSDKFDLARGTSELSQTRRMPTPPEDFTGRDVDIYKALNTILSRRFVSLVGPQGVGRSSLAMAICNYMHERLGSMIEVEDIIYVQGMTSADSSEPAKSLIASLHGQICRGGSMSSCPLISDLGSICHHIIDTLGSTRTLIIFDGAKHTDDEEMASFLSSLFHNTRWVRVLMTGAKPLGNASFGGVGEYVFEVGPLSLENATSLFLKQCPYSREDDKKPLTKALSDENLSHLRRKVDGKKSHQILQALIGGVPSRILQVSKCEVTKKDYEAFALSVRASLNS